MGGLPTSGGSTSLKTPGKKKEKKTENTDSSSPLRPSWTFSEIALQEKPSKVFGKKVSEFGTQKGCM
jgi:hypothetical protein